MQQSPPPSGSGRPGGGRRPPTRLLAAGLALTIATIAAVGAYTFREIRALRDEQTAISERNRKDSLQLLRIQNNLSRLATTMRDMADRVEPYPLVSWRQIFDRLRVDLSQAIALERDARARRRGPRRSRNGCVAAVDRFWALVDDDVPRRGAGDEQRGDRAAPRQRSARSTWSWSGWCRSSSSLNNRVQEEAAQRNQAIYDRVVREIGVLVAALLIVVVGGRGHIIRANRRAFDEVERLSTSSATCRGGCCGCRRICSSRSRASCTTSSARSSRPSARCWAA